MIMKVCCRQKNFSLRLKFWKFPLQLLVPVEAYLYVKNLTCCFESLSARLTTSTRSGWINVWLLLLPHDMQKTNFITNWFWDKAGSQFRAYSNCFMRAIVTHEAALFQNIFKFCLFLPKFSNILPFFALSLPLFWKIARMPLFLALK